MIIIGLTGSIGMGKSTTAAMFAAEGVPVYDADAEVHVLQGPGGAAVAPIETAFPGVVKNGAVDRGLLGGRVLGDPAAIKRLEGIVHPLLGASRSAFFERAEADGAEMVVLDIPLLFETGGEKRVDAVVVASAPEAMQRERVLARPGWDAARLDAVLAKQLHDLEKRARAHFIIDTSQGLAHAREQVRRVISTLKADAPRLEARGEPTQG
ncbi:MAG TPA: dephospho-CoA kinase [Caulobacteraceae bacterium]|jgi:dephospho-CoA kinase|nr:dephospho-CoA kinase [Caulobacteraceae bacterium]